MYQWVAPSKHIITSHNFVGLICPQDTASCGDPVEEENRNNGSITSTNQEVLFRLSLDACQENNMEGALRYLNRLIELNPDHAGAFNQAGIIACEMDDLEGAKTLFLAAIQKDPAFVDAQRNYAEVLLELEDHENGIQAYLKILENHPSDVQTLIRMAQLYEEVGRTEDAELLLSKVLEIDSSNERVKNSFNTIQKDI